MAIVAPAGNEPANQSCKEGVSGSPSLKSWSPETFSSSAACKKYRESVHTPPVEVVMTAVPAEPVNPEIHALDFHRPGIRFGGDRRSV